jgi:hypothetical protein
MTHSEDQFPYDRFPDEAEGFVPGADLFLGHAPRLRELVLSGIFIDPAWPPFAQLRALHLQCSIYTQGRVITLNDFLQLLARMPLLEELLTENALHRDESLNSFDELDALSYASVALHRLRDLNLRERTLVTLALLRALSPPRLDRLHIEVHPDELLFEETVAHLGFLLRPHVDAVVARLARSHVGLLLRWPSLIAYDRSGMPPEKAWLHISFGHPQDPYTALIASVSLCAPMDILVHLEVPCKAWHWDMPDEPPLSEAQWATLLSQLPSLQTLSARFENGCTVVRAFSGPRAHELCRALHTLVLEAVPLRRRADSPRSLLEALPGLVFARQQIGCPLAVLRLRGVHTLAIEAARVALGVRINQVQFEGIPAAGGHGACTEHWPALEREVDSADEVSDTPWHRLAPSSDACPMRRNCYGRDGRTSIHVMLKRLHDCAAQ